MNKLKVIEKEANAMKLMGKHDIDIMYGNILSFLKNIKKKYKLQLDLHILQYVNHVLDALVQWAIDNNKVHLKREDTLILTQDAVTIL